MATPKAPRNFEVLALRRRGFVTTLTPAPATCALALRSATLINTSGGGSTPGVDADFLARATASSNVLYATNFTDVYLDGVKNTARSGMATKQDIIDEAGLGIGASSFSGRPVGQKAEDHLDRETVIKLSGGCSLRMNVMPTDGQAAGSWAFNPDGRTPGLAWHRLYIQFSVYYPRDTLAWRYDLTPSASGQLKVMNLGEFGNGQIVISNWKFLGFPSGFINGSDGMIGANTGNTISTPNAFNTNLTRVQDAIDTGGATTTQTDLLTRYGPLGGSGTANGMDTAFSASVPYLDQRTQPAGFPDTRAATHGIPFYEDDWTTIEVFIEFVAGDHSTVQMWAARKGQPPTLIIDDVGNLPLGGDGSNSWEELRLLNYDTERQTESDRPLQFCYYAEPIVSLDPIKFPGGYDLSGNIDDPAPSWVLSSGIVVNTWARVGGTGLSHGLSATNKINNIIPTGLPAIQGTDGPDAICKAWAGGAYLSGYSTHGGLGIWNGGHKNYYGNEFYAWDANTRFWARLTAPYPGPINFPVTDGYWPANGLQVNGSPSIPHTYRLVNYHPGLNAFITFRTMVDNAPDNTEQFAMLPLDTLVWQKKILAGFKIGSGGWSVYDSTRGTFVIRGGTSATESPRTISYNPTTNVATYFNPSGAANIVATYTVGAYDPVNDLIVLINGSGSNALWSINPANLGAAALPLTEVNAPTKANGAAFEYSAALGGFIYYAAGTAVYKVVKSGSNWVWTLLTNAGLNTVVPEDMEANQVFSKFQVMKWGTTELLVGVKRTGATGEGSVYAFRLS